MLELLNEALNSIHGAANEVTGKCCSCHGQLDVILHEVTRNYTIANGSLFIICGAVLLCRLHVVCDHVQIDTSLRRCYFKLPLTLIFSQHVEKVLVDIVH